MNAKEVLKKDSNWAFMELKDYNDVIVDDVIESITEMVGAN